MIITIDGPASSGKSTIARHLAKELQSYYFYSGMLYRACAYILKKYARYSDQRLENPSPEDVAFYCNPLRIKYVYAERTGEQIWFDDRDITSHLKLSEIDRAASIISMSESVRIEIMAMQRQIAQEHPNLIADGRDMGSVAFPHADYKFFLTASVEARAKRWIKDQENRGISVPYEKAHMHIVERDQRDTVRLHAPLVIPRDAITIDTTMMTLQETIIYMLKIIKHR